jgi:hypothetical protein
MCLQEKSQNGKNISKSYIAACLFQHMFIAVTDEQEEKSGTTVVSDCTLYKKHSAWWKSRGRPRLWALI